MRSLPDRAATTAEDYTILLHKKEWYLKNTALHDATISLALEEEIADVVERISTLKEEEFSALNYNPVMLSNKFYDHEILIKSKISTYVTLFYPFMLKRRTLSTMLDRTTSFSRLLLARTTIHFVEIFQT